jgi:NADPH-dependent curcumin reductase CurA
MNRQITLAARPNGFPQESDFALVESESLSPAPERCSSVRTGSPRDRYMRGRMSEARVQYARQPTSASR